MTWPWLTTTAFLFSLLLLILSNLTTSQLHHPNTNLLFAYLCRLANAFPRLKASLTFFLPHYDHLTSVQRELTELTKINTLSYFTVNPSSNTPPNNQHDRSYVLLLQILLVPREDFLGLQTSPTAMAPPYSATPATERRTASFVAKRQRERDGPGKLPAFSSFLLREASN
jgi:hypothetical protein